MRFNFSFIERRILGIQFISMQHSLDRGDCVYVYPYIVSHVCNVLSFAFHGAKLFRELDFREIVVNDEHDRFACLRFLSRTMISLTSATIAVAFTRISQTSKTHDLVAIRKRRTRQVLGYLLTGQIFVSSLLR